MPFEQFNNNVPIVLFKKRFAKTFDKSRRGFISIGFALLRQIELDFHIWNSEIVLLDSQMSSTLSLTIKWWKFHSRDQHTKKTCHFSLESWLLQPSATDVKLFGYTAQYNVWHLVKTEWKRNKSTFTCFSAQLNKKNRQFDSVCCFVLFFFRAQKWR